MSFTKTMILLDSLWFVLCCTKYLLPWTLPSLISTGKHCNLKLFFPLIGTRWRHEAALGFNHVQLSWWTWHCCIGSHISSSLHICADRFKAQEFEQTSCEDVWSIRPNRSVTSIFGLKTMKTPFWKLSFCVFPIHSLNVCDHWSSQNEFWSSGRQKNQLGTAWWSQEFLAYLSSWVDVN